MNEKSRRDLLKVVLAGSTLVAAAHPAAAPKSAYGIEGQRKADLGDGTFINPIVAGDHPDPTVLKDGDDYYMTFSSFYSYPGAVIWHSRDLVNWTPIGPALTKPLGSVWAMDLVKHKDRYYIYIPANPNGQSSGARTSCGFSVKWKARRGSCKPQPHRAARHTLGSSEETVAWTR